MIPSPYTTTGLTPIGFEPPEPDDMDIGFWDPLKAAFGLDNDVTNFLRWSGTQQTAMLRDADPNAWIEETSFRDSRYEQMYLDRFVDVQSTAEARAIMGRIDQEEHYRELLARSGDRGFIAQLAAGVLSPTSLIPIAGWYSAMAKAGRAARVALGAGAAAASGGVAVGIQEGFLQSVQETRPVAESVFNMVGGVLLSGILGAGAAALSRQATDELARRIMSIPASNQDERNLFTQAVAEALGLGPSPTVTAPTGRPAAGGAQVTSSERGSGRLASSLGANRVLSFQDPLFRTQANPFEWARNTVRDLAESPQALAENAEGIATTIGGSVETRVKMARAPLAQALRGLDEQFQLYYFGARSRFAPMRSEFNRATGRSTKKTYTEFKEAVFDAMYNGDVSDIPEVTLAAKQIRSKVIDPLAKEAADAGIPLGQILGDASYAPRIYNTQAIRARRSEFVNVLVENFRSRQQQLADEIETLRTQSGTSARIASLSKAADLSEGELRALAQDVTDFILHNSPDRLITPAALVEGPRGALQEHILEIPTKMIREFLERDIEVLARMYSRTVATDANLIKKFGSVDMREPIKKINEEANKLIDNVKAAVATGRITEAEARIESNRLGKWRDKAIRDISAIRDRLRGTYALPDNPDGLLHRAGNVVRNLNYLRLLGGMTLSAIPDLAKPVFAYGLGKTMRTAWAPFTGKLGTYKLAANEVKLAGTALDMILDSRVMAIADILDSYGRGSKFERGLAAASRRFGVVSLMSPWNAAIKQFTGVIAQSKMLETIGKVMAGTASKKEIGWLASAGINRNYAERIWNQVAGSKGSRGYDQSAYHGTPRKEPFDRFSTKFRGTGEGHQAFGWGLYFADEYGLGKYYRDTYSEWSTFAVNPDGTRVEVTDPRMGSFMSTGNPSPDTIRQSATEQLRYAEDRANNLMNHIVDLTSPSVKRALLESNPGMTAANVDAMFKDRLATLRAERVEAEENASFYKGILALVENPGVKIESAPTGRIYKVDIPDHDTLAFWDGTMAEQPPAVRKALESIPEFRKAWLAESRERLGPLDDPITESLDYIPYEDVYRRMQKDFGDNFETRMRGDEAASKAIADAGVPGHRFYDGNSRHMPKETFEYSTDKGGWREADHLMGRSADKFIRPYVKGFPEGRTVARLLEYLEPFVTKKGGVWETVALAARDALQDLDPTTVLRVRQNKRTYNYVIYDDAHIKIQSYEQEAVAPYALPRFNFQTDFPGRAEVDDLMDAAIRAPTAENLDALSAAARDAGRDPNISPSDAAKLKDLRKAVQRKQFELSQSYDQPAPGTAAFDNWFKGSKVVDEAGEPLVVYHRGGFDENVDPIPRVNDQGFHFGTKQSAEERVIGKDLDDMFRSATFHQADDGFWYWDMDGMEADVGFSTQAEARNDAFSTAQNQAENRDWDPDDGMPMTAVYLNIKNPMRTTDKLDSWASTIEEAKAKGHDGIVYKNDVEDAGKDSYIAFYPEQIKSVNNRGTYDPNDPNVLNQDTPIGPRARITMSQNRTLIELFKSRDASSFLHETGHKWLDELATDATAADAPAQLVADFNKVLKWLKIESIDDLRSMTPEGIAANEKWAKAVERYLATGKAPNKGLQAAFDQFKTWLLKIYETIKSIGIVPPNEIKGVMNRLLVTDDPRPVVYHGSKTPIDSFDPAKVNSAGGFWFAANEADAAAFGTVSSYRLNVTKPATLRDLAVARREVAATGMDINTDAAAFNAAVVDNLKAKGFDGVHDTNSKGAGGKDVWTAFDPNQIESLNELAASERAVFNDVRSQLLSAGVSKEEAEVNAALWAARYSTRAARRGRGETPEALYRAEGLDIRAIDPSRRGDTSGGQSGYAPTPPDRIKVPETGHGQRDGDVWWANTEKWGDKQAVEAFRAALVREVDKTITTPGQDIPLWMSTGLGRIIGQFKSFGLASVQRTLVSGLQQRDMAALNGTLMMLALGALSYKIKSEIAGVETSDNAGKWITEALSQSGLLGWLMDANNIAQRATGGKVGLSALTGEYSTRYAAGDAASTLFGPTFELFENVTQLGYAAANPDKLTVGDVHVARRLVPLQNLFYIRWLFDQAEAGARNAFGVQNGG